MLRKTSAALLAISLAAAVGACGDTWKGAKKDTGENLESTGQAIENAGENVKK